MNGVSGSRWREIVGRWVGGPPGESAEGGGGGSSRQQSFRAVILLVALGLVLVMFSRPELGGPASTSGPGGTDPGGDLPAAALPEYVDFGDQLERELTLTLRQVEGVGDVTVFLTLEGGEERIVELETEWERTMSGTGDGQSVTERRSERPVLLQSERAETPLVRWTRQPRLRGVVVVAAGGADPMVQSRIIRAVQAVFDLPPHRIAVLPGS